MSQFDTHDKAGRIEVHEGSRHPGSGLKQEPLDVPQDCGDPEQQAIIDRYAYTPKGVGAGKSGDGTIVVDRYAQRQRGGSSALDILRNDPGRPRGTRYR